MGGCVVFFWHGRHRCCHTVDAQRHVGVLPCSSGMINVGAHNTVDVQRHMGGALPCLSGMRVDATHNTVEKMSAPTTLLGFCHVWKVAGQPSDMPCWYCPVGVQGTVLSITVLTRVSCFTCSARYLVLTERASAVGWSQSAPTVPVGEEL